MLVQITAEVLLLRGKEKSNIAWKKGERKRSKNQPWIVSTHPSSFLSHSFSPGSMTLFKAPVVYVNAPAKTEHHKSLPFHLYSLSSL
jgi:hypothetical protein